jgi:hypothetical protein
MNATAAMLQQLLLWAVLPLWLLAGFGDWLCHRMQRIEHDAGTRESLLHALMLAEMALALTAALLLEITAAVLVLLLALCVAHELTTWQDLRYASSRRRIPWEEQWVHAVQLSLPWAGLVSLALIHLDQTAALLGHRAPNWSWHLKEAPLPPSYLAGVAAAAGLLVALPFAEELIRCRRTAAQEARSQQRRRG